MSVAGRSAQGVSLRRRSIIVSRGAAKDKQNKDMPSAGDRDLGGSIDYSNGNRISEATSSTEVESNRESPPEKHETMEPLQELRTVESGQTANRKDCDDQIGTQVRGNHKEVDKLCDICMNQ